ncbi:MAG: hypothetical protein HZC04_00130 [Candidatus Lloydbacteria bacterium]|nr:hypothetical protein [Candidatus Lloydbacteria bacterium]
MDRTVIEIDRSKPFDLTNLCCGEGYYTVVNNETDSRSIALKKLDITKVRFVTMLKDGESCIKGEEKLKRLKSAGHIRLDAKIFWVLWENEHLIPKSWRKKASKKRATRFIHFDGLIFLDRTGLRHVPCLYWEHSEWHWCTDCLDSICGVDDPSAVLKV